MTCNMVPDNKAFFAALSRIEAGKDLFKLVNSLSFTTTYLLATLMLIVIAAADYFSHVELTLSPFYTFPCFLVDWRIGRRPALGYAVFAALLQLLIGFTGTHNYPNNTYLFVDLVLNLAYCVILIWIIAKLRLALEMETILSRGDFLTQLGNRDSFLANLENELAICRNKGQSLTVILLDLDQLKEFNEARGHSNGDLLLKATADELRHQFRNSDIISRLGDDEFVVVLPAMSAELVESKLNSLRNELSSLMVKRGWNMTFGMASIVISQPSLSANQVITNIQGLMQEVKLAGANGFIHRVLSIDGFVITGLESSASPV